VTDTTRTALDLDAIRREWTLVDDTKAGQTIIALCDEVEQLRADRKVLQQAVQYIARPTMALPGNRDAEEFVRTDAKDRDVRLALETCIRTARVALDALDGP
jgi:hypothetical protein